MYDNVEIYDDISNRNHKGWLMSGGGGERGGGFYPRPVHIHGNVITIFL